MSAWCNGAAASATSRRRKRATVSPAAFRFNAISMVRSATVVGRRPMPANALGQKTAELATGRLTFSLQPASVRLPVSVSRAP